MDGRACVRACAAFACTLYEIQTATQIALQSRLKQDFFKNKLVSTMGITAPLQDHLCYPTLSPNRAEKTSFRPF